MMQITTADYNRKNALFFTRHPCLDRLINVVLFFKKKKKKFKEEFLKDLVQ